MRLNTVIIALSLACVLSGGVLNSFGQDIPLSEETTNLKQQRVNPDKQLGVSTSPIGEQLFQMDVTLIEIPPGGKLPPPTTDG